MKLKSLIIPIVVIILFIITTFVVLANYSSIFSYHSNNNTTIISNSTVNPTIIIDDPTTSYKFPPNDYTINHINWSVYSNLQTGYVYTACISEPTDVIPYKFVEVEIVTEVHDTENETTIHEQLAGVAIEAKKIYGPISSIDIIGTKGGIARWFASILPYDNKIYY